MPTRNPRTPYVHGVRPLTADDIQYLRERSAASSVQRIRDSHHNVCRLAAMGLPNYEIARKCGYSYSRISIIINSPAGKELISHYRDLVTDSWLTSVGEMNNYLTENAIKAERMIADRLDLADANDDTLPIRELIAISRDAADRIGHGKRNTTLNMNFDFAAKLESAIRRTESVSNVIPLLPKATSDAA